MRDSRSALTVYTPTNWSLTFWIIIQLPKGIERQLIKHSTVNNKKAKSFLRAEIEQLEKIYTRFG